jgi:hypothetical protein
MVKYLGTKGLVVKLSISLVLVLVTSHSVKLILLCLIDCYVHIFLFIER